MARSQGQPARVGNAVVYLLADAVEHLLARAKLATQARSFRSAREAAGLIVPFLPISTGLAHSLFIGPVEVLARDLVLSTYNLDE